MDSPLPILSIAGAAVIGTAIISGVNALGQKLGTTFTSVQNKLK